MTAYLGWWLLGGAIGVLAGLLVLRHRHAYSHHALLVYAVATVACVYGAKLQYRLRFLSLLDAIAVRPTELMTPGFHIPLGLVLAVIAAAITCRLMRLAFLQIGDALAMTGAVMMPIGRIGCLVAGCCLGVACPTWMAAVCVLPHAAAGPGVDGAPDVPVHLLPAYFAILGLVTALVHLLLLRRRVPAGTLLAVGLLLYPLGHLAIEQLRDATPDRVAVMRTVLLGTVVLDVLAVGLVLRVRRARGRASRTRTTGAVESHVVGFGSIASSLIIVSSLGASHAHATTPPQWQSVLTSYAQAPDANRTALLRLGKQPPADLPPFARIAIADANLRSNHLGTAAQQFDDLIDSSPGEPWTGLAAVGRGWVAARRGQLDDARGYFDAASTSPGGTGQLADLMVGLLDAGNGGAAEALERFDRLTNDSGVTNDVRTAAAIAEGYTRFWLGDDAGARDAFAKVSNDETPDAARLGDALAQWRQGDRSGAENALRALATTAGGAARGSSGVASLDPHALIRAGARAYRRMPLRMPADQVLALLAPNAPAAARIALKRLEAGQGAPQPLVRRATHGHQPGSSAQLSHPSEAANIERGSSSANPSPASPTSPAFPGVRALRPLVLVLATLAGVRWVGFGRHPGGSR